MPLILRNQIALLIATAAIITGCGSQIPITVRKDVSAAPHFEQVQHNIIEYKDRSVRWGGIIQSIDNKKLGTELEIIVRKLDNIARPLLEDSSPGRFIAIFEGFLEPAIYEPGREITIVGRISGQSIRLIGEYNYTYPIVNIDSHHLWEKQSVAYPYDYPWYGPWYDPWYPWWYH